MVEQIIHEEPPDFERLERMSVDYIQHVRSATRPFSALLFLMPVVLLLLWIYFIDNPLILLLSVSVYIAVVLMSVYSRFRVDLKYRDLDSSFPYYLTHSDASMYTIRIAALVLAVLMFILIDTYNTFNQYLFFSIVNGFILLSLILSIFSPRFLHYGRSSMELPSAGVSSRIEFIAGDAALPKYTLHIIPEKRMKVANAYCVGMVRHRIFVTDYLLENLSDGELVSIIAHEMGHVKYRHNLKTLVMTFMFLFLSSAFFFAYLYIPVSLLSALLAQAGIFLFILGIPAFIPAVRRSYELQADQFASLYVPEETAVNSLLKTNYLNLTPIQLSGGATHPPLMIRISRIRESFRRRGNRMDF